MAPARWVSTLFVPSCVEFVNYSSHKCAHQESCNGGSGGGDDECGKQDAVNGSLEPLIMVHPHLGEVIKFPVNGKHASLHDSALELQWPKHKAILDLSTKVHDDDDYNDFKISYSFCWKEEIIHGTKEF